MRIAYITTYQGPSLLKSRPVVRNRSLSNAVKIELVGSCLREASHEVEVISQGEVIENQFRFYASFCESQRFHSDIPIYYASAVPIRRLNGLWSSRRTLQLFKNRHRAAPFDLVVIFNLKEPQVTCANYAIRRLGLPVVLEYEDDRFVDPAGAETGGITSRLHDRLCRKLLKMVAGCIAVSPHLLSQVPESTPKMLLRGVAGGDLIDASKEFKETKRNWILFSGTHIENNGVAQLIEAWRSAPIAGWELHITGKGVLTDSLRQMAKSASGVKFHGLVSRQELVKLMCTAKICINPYTLSRTPGNVFAFKVIEYLAAGAHCVTTPMGSLEQSIETGITYMPDNSPRTIAATLKDVIEGRHYERLATDAVQEAYSPTAVSERLDFFLTQLVNRNASRQTSLSQGVRQRRESREEISHRPSPLIKPLVSILIPAYNAEKWLGYTLQSAIAQTWPRKEIIVIDDGSRDRTAEVAQRFASQGVSVVSTENLGAAAARNHALQLSQGDYIQWLDADDLLAPDKIERQLAALQKANRGRILLSSPWAYFCYRPQRAQFIPTSLWEDLSPVEWLLRKMSENLHMQTATWLTSRELTEAAGPWDTRLISDDDGEYFCRVLRASEGTHFVPEARVFYRITSSDRRSYVGHSDEKKDALLVSMKLQIQYARSLEDSQRVRRACLVYIRNWLDFFYPERPDILVELQILATQLGGHLEKPRLRGKYAWMEPIFGYKSAKSAQMMLPQLKVSLLRLWEKMMFELENHKSSFS